MYYVVRVERRYEVEASSEQEAMFNAIHEGHELPHENGAVTVTAVGPEPTMTWAYDGDGNVARTEQLTRAERDEQEAATAKADAALAVERADAAKAAAAEFPQPNLPRSEDAEAAQRRQVADGERAEAKAAAGYAAPEEPAAPPAEPDADPA